MEKGCGARLRLKPTSGHGGTLDARVARNQPREGRGKSSSQGDSDVRGEGNGRARANLCYPLLGVQSHTPGSVPCDSGSHLPTNRCQLHAPPLALCRGRQEKLGGGSRSENDADPRRARPSSLLLVAPPIPPPPRTWSFTLSSSEFLTGEARLQLFIPSTNPPRRVITYRSWRAPGRAGSIGRETGDG